MEASSPGVAQAIAFGGSHGECQRLVGTASACRLVSALYGVLESCKVSDRQGIMVNNIAMAWKLFVEEVINSAPPR